MKKEFVKYETALALKELGFDEPCLASYETAFGKGIDFELGYIIDGPKNYVLAPLWQQAFEWMREKHELVVDWNHSQYDNAGSYIGVSIKNIHLEETVVGVYKSYEEAEQACLDKLIEIVKNK